MSRRTDMQGFTLVELMVTIALLAIFASIALPGFGQLINNNRTQAVGNELLALLQFARSQAVERRIGTRACFTSGSVTIRQACNDTDALRNLDFPNGVTVAASADDVLFRANGTADKEVVYTICQNDDFANGFTLRVATTGRLVLNARGLSAPGENMTSCDPS